MPPFSSSEDDAHAPPAPPETPPLRCETSAERGSARIAVVGELDLATVTILESEVNAQRAAGFRRVILDLRELQFIDSTGLRCILDCYTEARRDGFTLALIPGPRAIEQVFELTDTRAHLPFIDP